MVDGAHQEKPISLFYSYSHRDEALRGELEVHLSFMRRSKLIAEWHDRMIGAGDEWKGQIDRQLAAADIILLLVSADFIDSDYCWDEEMTKALARHQLGDARVIPVILRPCRWQSTPLGSLQAVPKYGKPVSEWSNHDAAFDEIATAIQRTIADLQKQRRRADEQAQQQTHEGRNRPEAKARQAAKEQQRETHDDEAPHRVLRIPMPGPGKKECFVAISFDRALDHVSGAIAEAVSSHGFKFKRVDLSPEGPRTENVPEGIREAAVVVAVINNKAGVNCRINANVAYELGVAHALGKPVIIIVDDTQNTHFSDIGHFHWIESHPGGEFRRFDFIAHLKNALTNVMNQPYSHPLWPAATLSR